MQVCSVGAAERMTSAGPDRGGDDAFEGHLGQGFSERCHVTVRLFQESETLRQVSWCWEQLPALHVQGENQTDSATAKSTEKNAAKICALCLKCVQSVKVPGHLKHPGIWA